MKFKVSNRDSAKCVYDFLGSPEALERIGMENLIAPS